MPSRPRVLQDLTRLAGGVVSTAVGVKDEVEALLRHRIERLAQTLDLAPREDLESLRDVVVRAREEQERLNNRVAALERRLERLGAPSDGAAPPRSRRRIRTGAKKAG